MRNTFKLITLLLVMTIALSVLTACSVEDLLDKLGVGEKVENVVIVSKAIPLKHILLYDGNSEIAHTYAQRFADELGERGLANVNFIYSATVMKDDAEIIFGASDRAASKEAAKYVDEKSASAPNDFHWAIAYDDGVLAIVANSEKGYELALERFFTDYLNNGAIVFKSDLSISGTLTLADYNAYLEEQARIEAEKRAEENRKLLNALIPKVESQREEFAEYEGRINMYSESDPIIKLFAQYTEDIGTSKWGASPVSPEDDQHPRLLITSDMIPALKSSLAKENAFTKRFFEKLDIVLADEAILAPPVDKGLNTTVGTSNIHNYRDDYLEIIQTKALAYLAYGDELYGYQAIYYMKNYLKSLDIKQIASDQCRQYGYVMYTAAIVYDWCYDLLTDVDKTQFIAGVENCLCRGSNAYDKKMEVGFPPSGQGSVSGHGSEYQIMRDYLAFATAIYDENPSWWNYIAARVCNDYVQVRNYYFQSGITHQGTGYATARHIADFYSAWIIQSATGTNPFVGMENTVRSLLGYEFAPGLMFNDGDGTGDYKELRSFVSMAYLTAYLYEDEAMLAQADHLMNGGAFGSSYSGISNPAFLALTAMADIKPAEDRYEGMELIQYNGYPLGQYVIREAWDDPTSAAVMMRIKERSTGNHEHEDSGTFEIYYKGMLTSDGGAYNNYGHVHTQHFHQATISHNGLIIYNPSRASDRSGWYSGGQRALGETSTLDSWKADTSFDTGKVTGYQHGYMNDDPTKPLYAYIAGDITAAYDSNTVNYVGRRMLTVYTGEEKHPMVFFVYDDITSDNKKYEKRFLLQISSNKAPTIDEKEQTVITENGEGRLVLKCLSDNVDLNGVGGRNSLDNYKADQSQNYLINGKQLVPQSNTADDKHWGRVEIVYNKESVTATFLNVMYVTDAGNKTLVNMRDTTADNGLTGGIFDKKIVALFATSRTRATTSMSCKTYGSTSMDYYVSGLEAGSWNVSVNGEAIGTYEATKDGGMIIFKAPAGEVTVSPAK